MTKAALLEILGTEERIVNKSAAERYVGGAANLQKMRDGGLLKHFKKIHRDLQFDIVDLDAAIDHIKQHGWPQPASASPAS